MTEMDAPLVSLCDKTIEEVQGMAIKAVYVYVTSWDVVPRQIINIAECTDSKRRVVLGTQGHKQYRYNAGACASTCYTDRRESCHVCSWKFRIEIADSFF